MSDRNEAFWIDRSGDRERASDGRSRYSAYVRMNATAFTETADLFDGSPDLASVEFAAQAWRVATSPIMAPAYVQSQDRVLSAQIGRSHRDGSPVAEVVLIAPWPQPLRSSRDWHRLRSWSSWPTTLADEVYEPEPGEDDLSGGRSYLLTTVKALFAIKANALPESDLDAVEESAHAAVAGLVRQLSSVVTPILQQLEKS